MIHLTMENKQYILEGSRFILELCNKCNISYRKVYDWDIACLFNDKEYFKNLGFDVVKVFNTIEELQDFNNNHCIIENIIESKLSYIDKHIKYDPNDKNSEYVSLTKYIKHLLDLVFIYESNLYKYDEHIYRDCKKKLKYVNPINVKELVDKLEFTYFQNNK